MKTAVIALLAAAAASGQRLDLSALDKLADKASESANITLDGDRLKQGAGFVSQHLEGKAGAKEALATLEGVFVRNFEFENEGAYSRADLEPIRQQFKQAGWSRMVEVKEKNEHVEIWSFQAAGKPGALAILAAEPKEVSVVNIVGNTDLSTLSKLGLGNAAKGLKPATPPPPPPPPAPRD